MKILKLQAENLKRLRAIEITPDGNTVVIAGRNGQGKTSVLDAIWFALGGGPAMRGTAKPIREGTDRASVSLDLGDIRVTRTWAGDNTTLRVESADGARYSSPQAMLDGLVGRMSFDPLAFAQQDERTQLGTLLDLIDLSFDPVELDVERRALYEDRTITGREVRMIEGQVAGVPEVPADVPAAEISAADVIAEYRRAREAAEARQAAERAVAVATQHLERVRAECETAEKELVAANARLSDAPAAEDLAQYEQRLATIEETNRQVRAAQTRAALLQQLRAARSRYDEKTAALAALDQRKADAIRDAQMPITGLAFDDDGVTYNGIPFKQCSAAEQLRVSLAMAMALNPSIRVIRITDGSLLDSENLRLIEEMAADRDFQVWIERVDETGAMGVLIEDGQVANAPVAAEAAS